MEQVETVETQALETQATETAVTVDNFTVDNPSTTGSEVVADYKSHAEKVKTKLESLKTQSSDLAEGYWNADGVARLHSVVHELIELLLEEL